MLDLSSAVLATVKKRIRSGAESIQWVATDFTTWEPPRAYDVWRDRATFHFHFMVALTVRPVFPGLRAASRGGHAIIATFAPDGPEQCSGLPVRRYDTETLGRTLGAGFQLISSRRHEHITPCNHSSSASFATYLPH